MIHEKLKEKALGLYDGPVTEKERIWTKTHLSSCIDCNQAVEEYKNIASTLFVTPSFSEAQEDIFTAKVMAQVKLVSTKAAQSIFDITIRWFIPLLGSTLVASWVFFSVLPNTPNLSNEMNGSAYFSSDAHEITSKPWTPVDTDKSNEEIVVSWMKE